MKNSHKFAKEAIENSRRAGNTTILSMAVLQSENGVLIVDNLTQAEAKRSEGVRAMSASASTSDALRGRRLAPVFDNSFIYQMVLEHEALAAEHEDLKEKIRSLLVKSAILA